MKTNSCSGISLVQITLQVFSFKEIVRISILQCSRSDVSDKLRKNIEDANAVHIANPKTFEFQVSIMTSTEIEIKYILY